MKKTILLVLTFLLLISCEKRKFQFIGNISIYETIHLNEDDSFTKTETINEDDVRQFLKDIPDDVTITDVNITAIGMRMIPKSGNQASVITMFGTLHDFESSIPLFPEGDFEIPASVDDVIYIPLVTIYEPATEKLLNFAKSMLIDDVFWDMNVTTDGFSKTGEYDILADSEIQVQLQVIFESYQDVPNILGAPYNEGL